MAGRKYTSGKGRSSVDGRWVARAAHRREPFGEQRRARALDVRASGRVRGSPLALAAYCMMAPRRAGRSRKQLRGCVH